MWIVSVQRGLKIIRKSAPARPTTLREGPNLLMRAPFLPAVRPAWIGALVLGQMPMALVGSVFRTNWSSLSRTLRVALAAEGPAYRSQREARPGFPERRMISRGTRRTSPNWVSHLPLTKPYRPAQSQRVLAI